MRHCLIALCCFSLVASTGANLAATPISRLQLPWWKQRFEQKQAEIRAKSPDLIWLGDSITQDWERDGPEPWTHFKPVWDHFYGSDNAIDLGFKGDSTCHLLWRMLHGELDGYQPKVAVILIGANNFGRIHTDADATFSGIIKIVDVLHQKSARTRVVLVGVLPSIRSTWVDANTIRLNGRLRSTFNGDPLVTFVDASPIFTIGHEVDKNAFIDPRMTPPEPALHPTAQAQARLAALLEPIVQRDLGIASP